MCNMNSKMLVEWKIVYTLYLSYCFNRYSKLQSEFTESKKSITLKHISQLKVTSKRIH